MLALLLLLPSHSGGGGARGAGGNGRSIGRSVGGTRSRSSLHTRGAHVKLCYARRRRRWRTYRVTHHMTFTVRRSAAFRGGGGAAAYPVVSYLRTEAVSSLHYSLLRQKQNITFYEVHSATLRHSYIVPTTTDDGRPMKPFFIEISNFCAWTDKLGK